ncbi:MAG TPA: response regulator transcription factor [Caldilineaceae bacterium]|nr:response regulator transcription factor [Caldilineaceae bacterium]HRW07317.1 response regulator transcription factor [Caldilineaceae bacterium]
MKILIVDDHILFREGLASLLNVQNDVEVIGQAGTIEEAVQLAVALQPELILMDFGLPDGTGLEATQRILAIQADLKIVFLTVYEDEENLFKAIRAGAKGYLLKNVAFSTLLLFLRGVERGEPALTPAMTSKILQEFVKLPQTMPEELDLLTSRELEIAKHLRAGATNREIADRLFIAENTVKNHVRHILAKYNLHSRRQMINFDAH